MSSTAQTPLYTEDQIRQKLEDIPRLASLRSISSALSDLLGSEYSFTAQIAEIIRRDPSLTSRLLKLVNSVFFGISQKITNIEEAVFYLGMRQIRELAIATPVIEDFEKIQADVGGIQWRNLWQHSIGCALLTREILTNANILYEDDTDYLIGLLHKVGKIAMASAFPEEFSQIHSAKYESSLDLAKAEKELIGWDHTEFAAFYLKKNNLSQEIITAIRYQYEPERAERYARAAAAINIANHMLQQAAILSVEDIVPQELPDISDTQAWQILFSGKRQNGSLAQASLNHTLKRLPMTLKGMV